MKKDIHPKYNSKATVTCVCGNTFTTGSTLDEIKIEICHLCHPFYTGNLKLVDTARRIEKFKEKLVQKDKVSSTRKGKKVKRAEKAERKVTKAEKEK